jgi:hypothetical protein
MSVAVVCKYKAKASLKNDEKILVTNFFLSLSEYHSEHYRAVYHKTKFSPGLVGSKRFLRALIFIVW